MRSITLVALEVGCKAQCMQAGHRRPQPGSKRAGRDGGHDVTVVDDGGDVRRARPRQFNRHAGRARNRQARRLRQLRRRIPQPARACHLTALYWRWGKHGLQASESFLQKRPGSSSCNPEQTPMAKNGLAHASKHTPKAPDRTCPEKSSKQARTGAHHGQKRGCASPQGVANNAQPKCRVLCERHLERLHRLLQDPPRRRQHPKVTARMGHLDIQVHKAAGTARVWQPARRGFGCTCSQAQRPPRQQRDAACWRPSGS